VISRERLVLNAFSMPHACGLLPTLSGDFASAPLGLDALAGIAKEAGLSGIDAPLPMGVEHGRPVAWRASAPCKFVVEGPDLHALSEDSAIEWIRGAARSGSSIVRFIASPLLCGERLECSVGWESRLRRIEGKLARLLPIAQGEGVAICLENHQDLDSEDLLRLADAVHGHPNFGVVFDTGNPLAVAEHPLVFLERIAPLVHHVHLKDYQVHWWEHGFRLVRCHAGRGVVPFVGIARTLSARCPHDWTAGIEVAAQATRSIRASDPRWHAGFPGRSLESFSSVLGLLAVRAIPAGEPFGSVWENGGDSKQVLADEWQVLQESIAYFHGQPGLDPEDLA